MVFFVNGYAVAEDSFVILNLFQNLLDDVVTFLFAPAGHIKTYRRGRQSNQKKAARKETALYSRHCVYGCL